MTIKLTEMEEKVLTGIDNSEFGDDLTDQIWTCSIENTVPKGSLGGVLGSLSKKGLVDIMDWEENMPVVNLTQKGVEVYTTQINPNPVKPL